MPQCRKNSKAIVFFSSILTESDLDKRLSKKINDNKIT